MQYNHPWPHFVMDNFLSEERLLRLQSLLPQHSLSFRQDEDDDMKINYKFLPDIELAKYFLGPDFKNLLETTTGCSLKINSKSLVQLRMMTASSPAMPPHVDNQDEKSFVCILYISPAWNETHGGELCLLNHKDEAPQSRKAKIIEPLTNRLVLFCSEDTHWHCVQPVKNWIRYSIIMEWIICSEEKSK